MERNTRKNTQSMREFLGSVHIFSSAIHDVVEKRLLAEVAGRQLSFSQFRVLKMVALTGAHSVGDVALMMSVSKAAASKTVDKLVRRKLLRRVEGEPDRRETHLALTEASRRLLAAYDDLKERTLARILRRYPARALRNASGLLDRLSAELVDGSSRPEEICLRCGIYFRDRCVMRQLTRRMCFYMNHRRRRQATVERGGRGSSRPA